MAEEKFNIEVAVKAQLEELKKVENVKSLMVVDLR